MTADPPSIAEVRSLAARLAGITHVTPVLRCSAIETELSNGTSVFGKLEILQRTGTFKARGAMSNLLSLTPAQLEAGVVAVSAGNHAIATAFAARTCGTSAKVVMPATANPERVERSRTYGAEVVTVADVHEAFDVARRIESEEGRFLVQPFEGPAVALGTGTLGLEICEQMRDLDALIVPVGGGGLMAGIANVVKQLRPGVTVLGVEPEGADSMHRSFAAGEPRGIERVATIADSLGAPYALPYSFELCRRNVDRLVLVDDVALRSAMGFLFQRMKFAIEPACAAATAALLGPLREELAGRAVGLVFCGSNIDWPTFAAQALFDD